MKERRTDRSRTASTLPEEVCRTVLSEARAAMPEEACGLLLGRREFDRFNIDEAVPCRNTAPAEQRANRFMIDPRQLIDAERTLRGSGREVVGFYHSHPDGPARPSEVDRTFMELWPDSLWLIVGQPADPDGGSLRGWVLHGMQEGGQFREVWFRATVTGTGERLLTSSA